MENVIKIAEKLKTINKKVYIVGGFCRDKFLDIESDGDIDLVTDALPEEMIKVLKVVGEVGKKYGTCIVSEGGEAFEVTTFRKDIGTINNRKPAEVVFSDSLEEDSKRRDFTFNAIYYSPLEDRYIDPEGGIEDIKNGIIRFVGNIEERIQEDALRVLRYIRFKNKYSLKQADSNYFKFIKSNIHLLENISIERIRQELDKVLLHKSNTSALEELKQIGFLDIFIPELSCLDKCLGNKYHLEGDVWTHTKMCVSEMNKNIEREDIKDEERKLILLRAILLHDIGKGPTFTVGDDGEGHYYDHENIGAEMFKADLSKRLKFSNKMNKKIYFIIKEHLRLFLIPQMRKLKSRKLMMQEDFLDLLLVGEADNNGRIPRKEEAFKEIVDIYESFKELLKTKEFLSGNDILEKYPDLKGREIKERLEQLNDQILLRG